MQEIIKEIGSEFYPNCNAKGRNAYLDLLDAEKRYVLSGRTALHHAASDMKAKYGICSAALPSYCCATMIEPFLKAGLEVSFYGSSQVPEAACVLILDYFGCLTEETLAFAEKCKAQGKLVIVDATQTAFSRSQTYPLADYMIVSYRKWTDCICAAVYSKDGFVIEPASERSSFPDLWRRAAHRKQDFIHEQIGEKSVFLEEFGHANHHLSEHWIDCSADDAEVSILHDINSEQLRRTRRENADILIRGLRANPHIQLLFSEIKDEDCPLFVPILTEQRDPLRRYLIQQNIYCPVHWPLTELHKDIVPTELYNRELSLLCDQRYGTEDMLRILSVINEFFENEVK